MGTRLRAYVRQHHLALLCLFLIVGGGTAWALERNSVRSEHIVNNEVKSADIAKVRTLAGRPVMAVNDLFVPNAPTERTLLQSYPFEVIGECEDDDLYVTARVVIKSGVNPAGISVNGAPATDVTSGFTRVEIAEAVGDEQPETDSGQFAAIAPVVSRALTGTVVARAKTTGISDEGPNCWFAMTAME
jgi:hypothetical protein